MDFTIRKICTKIITGAPSDVEEQANDFLSKLDLLNYVDVKVANSDNGTISVVIVYKEVRKLNHT